MGIEQDIKQSKFKSNRQKAAINIIYTNNFLAEKMRDRFAKEDLTPQQFNVLRILRGSNPDPLSTLQIRERMLDKMSDTSRIVDRLVIKSLVAKCTCKHDKRLVDVSITAKGLELLEKMDLEEYQTDDILKGLSEEEAELLSQLLDKVRDSKQV
jgi:DNA-binding MarR family transcriptional regulator